MNKIKSTIARLCDIMTVSGFEHRYEKEILSLLSEFGEASVDRMGNYIVKKRSLDENAPLLLIDAHIDEIGLAVTKIHDGGFLSMTSIGGIDAHILQSAEVEIYGKEKIYGVVTSTPPHLSKSSDNTLEKPEDLLIDTGIEKSRLETLIPIGSPIKLTGGLIELENDVVSARGLDNKACCACALEAISHIPPQEMKFNVAVVLSLREESGGYVGAKTALNSISPDVAISLDVNFAKAPETSEAESAVRGEGCTISLSAVTSRRLTKEIIGVAKYSRSSYRVIAEPNNVGMNANAIGLCQGGVHCADMGIPLTSMHTTAETVSLRDCLSLTGILHAFIRNEALAKEYSK